MAQFRATIQGKRGTASRLGTKKSGMFVSLNGWDLGVVIEATHRDGKDVFRIYRTGGSNENASVFLLELTQ